MTNRTKTRAAGAAWLIATLLGPAAHAASSSVGGTELEARELAGASPRAAALVADAEGAAREGASKQAWNLYSEAWSLAPRSPLPARGICRLTLALGIQTAEERRAAGEACTRALLLGGTPEDIRNKVAALIDGEPLPTMDDLVSASLAVDGASRTGPEQVWGPAARGDLALRLGDRELLDAAVAELRRIAPDHPETRRLITLATASPARWSWVGRLAVVLLFIFTIAHVTRARLRRSRRPLLSVVTVVALLFVGTSAAAAVTIDDAHPERSVPAPAQQISDPLKFADLLMELGARAEAATRRQDPAAAARYYAALAQAVPERSYAFGKLCDALDASGQRAEALKACGSALTRQGTTAADFTHYVKLLLAKDGPLTTAERKQAETVIAALDREPRAALIAARVRCNVAAHDHDLSALEACTAKLVADAPFDPSTIGFQWALALEKNDHAGADALAARAVAAGLERDTVARLRSATIGTRAYRVARALRWGLEGAVAFVIVALGVGLLVRYGERARRRTVLS
jgi:tetratricopeptide (TPR) repeat protein